MTVSVLTGPDSISTTNVRRHTDPIGGTSSARPQSFCYSAYMNSAQYGSSQFPLPDPVGCL